jgi:hypothetical protein
MLVCPCAQAMLSSMRVRGRKIAFDMDAGDSYLRWVFNKCLNTITLSIWAKAGQVRRDLMWRDSRIRFAIQVRARLSTQ